MLVTIGKCFFLFTFATRWTSVEPRDLRPIGVIASASDLWQCQQREDRQTADPSKNSTSVHVDFLQVDVSIPSHAVSDRTHVKAECGENTFLLFIVLLSPTGPL
jgi:hypothetical protein